MSDQPLPGHWVSWMEQGRRRFGRVQGENSNGTFRVFNGSKTVVVARNNITVEVD